MTDRQTGSDKRREIASQIALASGLHPDTLIRSRMFVVQDAAMIEPYTDDIPGRTDAMAMQELREKGADKNQLLPLTTDGERDIQNVLYMPQIQGYQFVGIEVVGGANIMLPNERPNLYAKVLDRVMPGSCGNALVEDSACRMGASPGSYVGKTFQFENITDFVIEANEKVVLIWVHDENAYVALTMRCCDNSSGSRVSGSRAGYGTTPREVCCCDDNPFNIYVRGTWTFSEDQHPLGPQTNPYPDVTVTFDTSFGYLFTCPGPCTYDGSTGIPSVLRRCQLARGRYESPEQVGGYPVVVVEVSPTVFCQIDINPEDPSQRYVVVNVQITVYKLIVTGYSGSPGSMTTFLGYKSTLLEITSTASDLDCELATNPDSDIDAVTGEEVIADFVTIP